jgi:NADH-quinone oxidoreductase subunit F
MERLNSIDEFKDLQARLVADRNPAIPTIVISAGTCGQASGANDLIRVTKRELLAHGLTERVGLRITGCHGFCEMEPSVLVEPHGTFYPKLGMKEMARVVEAVGKGELATELLPRDPTSGEPIARQRDLPFFKNQTRTILSRNEKVDPIRPYNYIENGGYVSLARVLHNGSREWVVNEVKASGLRGRGGAGFPTGTKWELLAKQADGRGKILVCNADEGDPGAYMDRSVLEGNPHSILEGMLIGAFATGATEGIIYVRNEYPLAIKHLVIALRQARDLGLLGEKILGTDFCFDINLVRGAGAFVCGEETALMRSIEGKMGEPRQRPPFPVERGVNGKPTAINNVETWANIPIIIERGAMEYSKVGTKKSAGTKIFSLVGKIKNTGLVEVPMGITLERIINGIGGGPVDHGRIKAVQTGGPSGGCIPSSWFDLTIDYDSLVQAGSIMGSGGMIVMDENTCMVDVAKYFMNFLKDESCGKCFTCRKGTQRMHELLDDISSGRGTPGHLDLLEELANVVKDTTMCGLGQSAANPVLSTLHYFRDEFNRHIWDKRCDAFVCKDLVGAPCQSACPIGTEAWRYVAHISRGEYQEAYNTIREVNPFPSVCARVCSHQCESRCKLGQTGSRPVAIRALKRFITDHIDPMSYKPVRDPANGKGSIRIAVVGSGPAGLTCAHNLSLKGYKVTVFETEDRPGGMLVSGVPEYRLPRAVLKREIESLLDENITLKCKTTFGKDFTLTSLFDDGYKAAFLALGAHRSRKLHIEGEDAEGAYPSMRFLKAWNLHAENLARGRVGIIGGGNSAIDAARVALRQKGVDSVTILYRRTRHEMPAFKDEIEAAIQEGVKLETLLAPVKIHLKGGKLTGVEFIKNTLGEVDASGRQKPVPIAGTEHTLALDTLVVAIGEQLQPFPLDGSMGIEISPAGTLITDPETLATRRPGVFAGGDVVTGPNTVVDAIAAGMRAATMIDRYVHDKDLKQIAPQRGPGEKIPASTLSEEELATLRRAEPPLAAMDQRRKSFAEVELSLSEKEAAQESKRCLRCDLEHAEHIEKEHGKRIPIAQTSGGQA